MDKDKDYDELAEAVEHAEEYRREAYEEKDDTLSMLTIAGISTIFSK